jgi:nascent polypeptide-associated complex subunit alpha
MIPGMKGINPAQMQRMMKQLGMKTEELNAKRVVFELEGRNLVIDNPNVSAVEVSGQKTYTVMGEAREEQAEASAEDVKLVMEQAGVGEEKAKKALEKAEGDIAQAILDLKKSD